MQSNDEEELPQPTYSAISAPQEEPRRVLEDFNRVPTIGEHENILCGGIDC